MRQDLQRALIAYERLMQALSDLDLGHIAEAVLNLQEQTLAELETD